MKALLYNTRDGRRVWGWHGIKTIVTGRSLVALINQANRLISGEPWRLEVHYNAERFYGEPDRIIDRGERIAV